MNRAQRFKLTLKFPVFLLAVFALVAVGSALASQRAAAAPVFSARPPLTIVAAGSVATCLRHEFFGLDPWYKYMDESISDGSDADKAQGFVICDVKCFNLFPQSVANNCGQTKSDVPGILLVVVDDLLRIAALVAIAFVLVGAFQYVDSRGNAERAAKAQSSIINALVGLAVALVAVGFIAFLGSKLV